MARALALRPKLLIADEPTAGLDVSVQGEMLNLLNELQARLGIAILIITHNLNVVRHVADRMAVMYLGRIVEEGRGSEIFAAPRHRYTAALLSANPVPDPDARRARWRSKATCRAFSTGPPAANFIRAALSRWQSAARNGPPEQLHRRTIRSHAIIRRDRPRKRNTAFSRFGTEPTLTG